MKRYYTVKEAADILGVSTNTIYKYLADNKIKSVRYGRGRFKIPASELSHFFRPEDNSLVSEELKELAVPQTVTPQNPPSPPKNIGADENPNVSPFSTIGQEMPQTTSEEFDTEIKEQENNQEVETPSVSGIGLIAPDKNDFLFFRFFTGLSFLGLGIIYLLTLKSTFLTVGFSTITSTTNMLLTILPFALLILGVFFLVYYGYYYKEKYRHLEILLFLFTIFFLVFYAYLMYQMGVYGQLIFVVAFSVVIATHLVNGIREYDKKSSFLNEFTIFLLIFSVTGGVLLAYFAERFPIEMIASFIQARLSLFLLIWFGWFIPISLYLLSSKGKKSRIYIPFYTISSVIMLIFSTELLIRASWDIAFMGYMVGIFGLFLVYWRSSRLVILPNNIKYISASFAWTTLVVVIGILALNNLQEQLKVDTIDKMKTSLSAKVNEVDSLFGRYESTMTYSISENNLNSVVQQEDDELVISEAKTIYDELDYLNGVIIYNQKGIARGIYPRNSLGQGTDFSSREYFTKTKDSMDGYITPVFTSIGNKDAVIQAEPIFGSNTFSGMVGVAVALDKLSDGLQSDLDNSAHLVGIDENSVYVVSDKEELIGEEADFVFLADKEGVSETRDLVTISQKANKPGWQLFLEINKKSLYMGLSSFAVMLSVLFVANSVISIGSGLVLTTKKNDRGV